MSDAASVRLYLLLDQDDRLYRRVLAALGSAEEALARPSRVWRSSPGLRLDEKYLLRHADWPRGELAADGPEAEAWLKLPPDTVGSHIDSSLQSLAAEALYRIKYQALHASDWLRLLMTSA